jgi:thiamine-phosphate pyrophosphorylase
VLIEDDVALARRLGADGVHVTGGVAAAGTVIAALKPAMIVGAGAVETRHDAMSMGEMGVDYVFFGAGGAGADLAQWWSDTFEIPAVLSLPAATADAADARGAEFVALSDSIWSAPAPAEAARAIASGLLEES